VLTGQPRPGFQILVEGPSRQTASGSSQRPVPESPGIYVAGGPVRSPECRPPGRSGLPARSPDAAAWSPPARKVLLLSLDDSEKQLELPGLSVSRESVVQWTPDSRSLYVLPIGSRPLSVELYDIQTGKRTPWRQLSVEDPYYQRRLRVTPDGRAYVLGSRAVFSELYLVEGLR
jgi:hypothetical protein